MSTRETVQPEPEFVALVGIDWADPKHVWCLQKANSTQHEAGELEHRPEVVEAWGSELCQRFGHGPIAVAVEQVKGALVYMLRKYECLHLYPVPSTMSASLREALYPSGAKDDPRDADLLLELLLLHRDKLRRLPPDNEATRRVQNLVEERRKLVEEKTAQLNRLSGYLKMYFPQMLEWFAKLDSQLVCDFLERWPSLEELQKVPSAELKKFFRHRRGRHGELTEWRMQGIGQAMPAIGDRAVIEAKRTVVRVIAQLLRTLLEGIATLERKIAEAAEAHPDFFIFQSLPGAGAALAPRLLAALGSQRDRYGSATEVQKYSGIAPVTERSGKKKWVHFRWACSKFLRQSFHEWAGHSIAQSVEIGKMARARGAHVVFGGIHASLYPAEARELGGAHAVVKGDGDVVWAKVLSDCCRGTPQSVYEGGRIEASEFLPARWDLVPRKRYMWASVQTVRGCPKHCSFCSVWRTDGQRPRQRASDLVVEEIVQLRQLGFRFIALADDNFYPVTLTDLRLAAEQHNIGRLKELKALRAERFELMARLALLPSDMIFFTQITMEAAEDPEFLDAMHAAKIKGALVGVESVTPQGLKDVYKEFNAAGEDLVERLRTFRRHGVYVLGSFIFGLPSDRPETFAATALAACKAEVAFAQFVMLTPYPGTVDFIRWEKDMEASPVYIAGIPVTRRWLIPRALRPKLYWPHPSMSAEEIRRRTQSVWDAFYSLKDIWTRSRFIKSMRARLAFVLISKIYRQMYADTGIATDSARVSRSARWARWLAKPCQRLFAAPPMPHLKLPQAWTTSRALEQTSSAD